jgi:hypothetical protein
LKFLPFLNILILLYSCIVTLPFYYLEIGKLKRPGLEEAAQGKIRAAGYPDEKTTPGREPRPGE